MPKRTAYVDGRSSPSFMPGLSIGIGAFLSIFSGASVSPNLLPPNEPTIGAPTVTAQAGDIVSIQWPIVMSSSGGSAASLTVDVFDATDTTFANPLRPQQVFTTGVGLGASQNVTFTNLDGMDGATPRSFVIRAEVA